jgi:Transposase domain (DUF772)
MVSEPQGQLDERVGRAQWAVPRADRSRGGRPLYDHVLMFRVLILQASHSLSDERTDYLIKDPREPGTSCRSP